MPEETPIGERQRALEIQIETLGREVYRARDNIHILTSGVQTLTSQGEEAKETRDRVFLAVESIPGQLEAVRRQSSAQITRIARDSDRVAIQAVQAADKAANKAEEIDRKFDELKKEIAPLVELKSDLKELTEFVRGFKWLWKSVAVLSGCGFFVGMAALGHFIWLKFKT